jgi:cell wall-associated NlpC family hydrolase
MGSMRVVCAPHLALVVVALSGCASRTTGTAASRETFPQASLERAREGREPPSTERGRAAVAFAGEQLGKGYCWGGTGPSCYDCSGLVSRAWATVGVRLPHSSEAIASALPEVALDDVRAGDVLWWPGHVALYAGSGWTIEALDARDGVIMRAARAPRRAFRPGGGP